LGISLLNPLKDFKTLIAAICLVVLFTLMVTLSGFNHFSLYIILVTSLIPLLFNFNFFASYEIKTRELMTINLLVAGKGLSSEGVKLLRVMFQLFISSTFLTAGFTLTYCLLRGVNLLYIAITLICFTATVVLYNAPRILVKYWVAQRKTASEVELPYLIILFRVLSSLRLPIYDIFSVIEDSVALKEWSMEVSLAKKISTLSHVSFISAMDTLCANHPSDKVRTLFRRIIIAAMTVSDVKDIAERVYDTIYSWFESRISSLTENFTIIVGSSMLAYFLIPLVVFAVAPVLFGNISLVLIITLSFQIFVFFFLYASIANSYPTSLVIQGRGKYSYICLAMLTTSIALLFYNVFSRLILRSNFLVIDDYLFVAVIVFAMTPPLILSELQMRNVALYDAFIRMTSDSLALAAVTGENAAQILEYESRRYGKNIVKMTRSILLGYTNRALVKTMISRAPSIYHASFLETLVNILTLGSTPEMLKAFTASYERLQVIASNMRRLATRLEGFIIGLAALIGGFLAYLDKTYNYMFNLARGIQLPGYTLVLNYDPSIYGLLNAITLLSIFFVSLLVGLVRSGSVNFSFRTIIASLIAYSATRYLFTYILVS